MFLNLKTSNMADPGGEFSFFRGIHVKINKTIDIFIFIRPMTARLGKWVHLEKLIHMRLFKQAPVTPSHQDHVTN